MTRIEGSKPGSNTAQTESPQKSQWEGREVCRMVGGAALLGIGAVATIAFIAIAATHGAPLFAIAGAAVGSLVAGGGYVLIKQQDRPDDSSEAPPAQLGFFGRETGKKYR